MSVINALSSASVGAIGLLVLLLLIDIGFGVLRSLTSSIQTARGHQLTIKGFDWTYLGNFARSVLFSPPVLAVAGSLWAAAQTSGATSTSILAAGSAAALTQDVILLRDIV
ncbi:MAG: hypothetical protein ACREQ5_34025, partial [Candidatus Dormibacteria bacterium]